MLFLDAEHDANSGSSKPDQPFLPQEELFQYHQAYRQGYRGFSFLANSVPTLTMLLELSMQNTFRACSAKSWEIIPSPAPKSAIEISGTK